MIWFVFKKSVYSVWRKDYADEGESREQGRWEAAEAGGAAMLGFSDAGLQFPWFPVALEE